jgi:hypothetical protein
MRTHSDVICVLILRPVSWLQKWRERFTQEFLGCYVCVGGVGVCVWGGGMYR